MKKLLFSLLALMMCVSAFAAGPTINEANRIQFTAADQETDVVFRITAIVWRSFTGSVIADTNVLNLENGAGAEVFKMTASATELGCTISIPGGIVVRGLKAEDLTKGYVTVYGQRL